MFLKYLSHYMGSRIQYSSRVLSLIEWGKISKKQIDLIKNHPNKTELKISGLRQDTFDYLIDTYGQQFKTICFFKCPRVSNLKKLAQLTQIELIIYFSNHLSDALWDLSKNKMLKGLCLINFNRLQDLSDIGRSKTLEGLECGDFMRGSRFVVKSLKPLANCKTLKYLDFSLKKVLDEDVRPLMQIKNLEELYFPKYFFSIEQTAWLKSRFIAHLKRMGRWKDPKVIPMEQSHIRKDNIFVPKTRGEKRIINDMKRFRAAYDWFEAHPKALLTDYNSRL